jgi:hypothetical protein
MPHIVTLMNIINAKTYLSIIGIYKALKIRNKINGHKREY